MKKPLIWHISLTAVYTECPYCKSVNSDDTYRQSCTRCGGEFDTTREIEKKSKDVIECERLGLKGAVRKDEKGNWIEVKL